MELRELMAIWKENDFRPDKRLGQNFMIDSNVRAKILREITSGPGGIIVEIGPGFGTMTYLLAEKFQKVFAVEKDKKIFYIMKDVFAERENVTFLNADILDMDLSGVSSSGGKITVFGNIPYYISTPIIEKVVDYRKHVDNVYIVMQEDLADRIAAGPGSRTYGSISCFVQFYTKPRKLFRIKKNSFYPKPKVESCLLKLEVLSTPSVPVRDEALMFRVIRRAFSERRKKIINPLASGDFPITGKSQWKDLLDKCGINASLRAENLSLLDYAAISNALGDIG